MMDSDSGREEEAAEEQTSPGALCHSVIFFCSKGMIEGVVVFLFIWLLIQVLLNKQQEVHLQVLLGAGLALLCFSLLLGCAICWHRSRRRQSTLNITDEDKDFSPSGREQELSEASTRSVSAPVPILYQGMDGDITPKGGEDSPIQQGSNSMLGRRLHSRASMPSLYQISAKTKRAIQRRSTVFSHVSLKGDYGRPMSVPHSRTESSGLSGVKQKLQPPHLHFTMCYSLREETLTVTVTGLSNLPKKFLQKKASWVKACLMPGFIEPHVDQEDGLGGQKFSFCKCSPGEMGERTLRLALFVRDRHNMKEGLFGEVLFSCAQVDWKNEGTSGHTGELSISKTRLKKSLSMMDVPCPPTNNSKSLGQILILLQYQMLANRIKVMVQKAENLGKLTRIPGAADHFVSIRLIQDGQLKEMKETRSVSGSSPVWNAPFLFEAPTKAVQEQTLCLEFLVMQGRIYNRARTLGRVLIGAGASESGLAHWEEMCGTGPMECARWHILQPDVF